APPPHRRPDPRRVARARRRQLPPPRRPRSRLGRGARPAPRGAARRARSGLRLARGQPHDLPPHPVAPPRDRHRPRRSARRCRCRGQHAVGAERHEHAAVPGRAARPAPAPDDRTPPRGAAGPAHARATGAARAGPRPTDGGARRASTPPDRRESPMTLLPEPAVRFEDVTITYGGAHAPALSHVDLAIEEGELALVVGRTGSGKSTLLRAINGLVPHFTGGRLEGRVLVAGRDTSTHQPRDLA